MTLIRTATPEDAPAIVALIQALAEYEREPHAVRVTPDTIRAQLQEDRPPFECLLAVEAGLAVGFALFFANYSTWRGRAGIYLEDLFVLPQHRGRGLGLALLRHLAGLALQRGCVRMEWSVLDWNTPAQDFYRSLGALPMEEWTSWRLADQAIQDLAEGARSR